jgi:small neutral amino acid transporter SnatA (MarC family)
MAEKYIGATVLFALVLFLVAVSQRFRILGVRIGAIAMAAGLLGYALYEVATLPRF